MKQEDKIAQLQLLEQSLNNFVMQKQQFQMQLNEIDSALSEIKNTKQAYKIVGNIMVLAKKEDLEKDLKSKKEVIELRIKTLEKQEEMIKDKSKKLQDEAMKEIKKQKK